MGQFGDDCGRVVEGNITFFEWRREIEEEEVVEGGCDEAEPIDPVAGHIPVQTNVRRKAAHRHVRLPPLLGVDAKGASVETT